MLLPIIVPIGKARRRLNVWIPIGDYDSVSVGAPAKRKVAFVTQFRRLRDRFGANIYQETGYKSRTVRSYYWVIEGRKKGRWDREPSEGFKHRISQLYERTYPRRGAREVVTDIGGILLEDYAYEDLYNRLLDYAKDRNLESYIDDIEKNEMYYYVRLRKEDQTWFVWSGDGRDAYVPKDDPAYRPKRKWKRAKPIFIIVTFREGLKALVRDLVRWQDKSKRRESKVYIEILGCQVHDHYTFTAVKKRIEKGRKQDRRFGRRDLGS